MKKKGFTLIELLVVIVMLAILLLIVFPNILGVRRRAEEGLNKEQEKNIIDAARLVAIDLDDYMSRIYNCKSGSWVEGKCEKDAEHMWHQVSLSVDDLINHDYFEDKQNHCSGDLSITKNDTGYDVKLLTVKCSSVKEGD